MKQVLGTFYGIAENSNYQQQFAKIEDVKQDRYGTFRGEVTPYKLYRVSCPNNSINPIMVLAETPDHAKGQATCEPGRSYEEQREIEKILVAEIVSFKIQGWGSTLF